MKVLVTGATGFIGSHLAAFLVGQGQAVVALVRPGSNTRQLTALGVEIVTADLCDAAIVTRAATGCGRVFHLAGARPANTRDSSSFRRVNVDGTKTLARAALEAGATRFVFASSVGVFGFARRRPVDETTLPRPDTPYRVSKLEAERALLDLHRREGLPVTIARLTSIVGPGSKSWLPFCRSVARADYRLIGTGDNRLQMAHVSDAVDGLVRCAEATGVAGETFIITAGEAMTVRDYVGAIRRVLQREARFGQLPAAPFLAFKKFASLFFRATGLEVPYARRYDIFLEDSAFDISKARACLNYHPQVTSAEAAALMVRWYQDEGWLDGTA